MKFSKDRELMAKHVFASITRIKNFKTIDYAGHINDRCYCGLFKFEFSIESGSSQKMNEYLNANRIDEFEKTQKDNEITYLVVLSKNRIKYFFTDLFRQILSSIKLDDKCCKRNSPVIKVLLYKPVNEEIIKHEIIEKEICKLTKNNPDIERALYLSIGSTYCTIEGTGCSCSQIEPLFIYLSLLISL